MKLKKRYNRKEIVQFLFLFIFLFFITCIGVGYSYLKKDLGSTGKITVDMKGPLVEIMKHVNTPQLDTGVDFTQRSSDTNGKGLMIRSGTQDDTNPIYYYRGAVKNNNVVFAGYCWKIVRTTEKGGVKLVYYGTWYSNSYCAGNYYLMDSDVSSSYSTSYTFNKDKMLLAYGFMYPSGVTDSRIIGYDTTPPTKTLLGYDRPYSSIVFSTNISYDSSTKNYTLTGKTYTTSERTLLSLGGGYIDYETGEPRGSSSCTSSSPCTYQYVEGIFKELENTNYHYTCYTDGTSCTTVYYITAIQGEGYGFGLENFADIPLTGGVTVESYLNSLVPNSTARNGVKSTALVTLETWYKNHMTSYSSKFEDAVWCANRDLSSSGINNTLFDENSKLTPISVQVAGTSRWVSAKESYKPYYFSNYDRIMAGNPAVKDAEACPNSLDRFTTSTSTGNGKLSYKVGLLTADEINLAGGASGNDEDSYLKYIATMSPAQLGYHASVFWGGNDTSNGLYDYYRGGGGSGAIAPSIVLTSSAAFVNGGDGTYKNPYRIS